MLTLGKENTDFIHKIYKETIIQFKENYKWHRNTSSGLHLALSFLSSCKNGDLAASAINLRYHAFVSPINGKRSK